MGKEVDIVLQMARKLTSDLNQLMRLRDLGTPKTFPRFREIRKVYLELQGLIFSIQERVPLAQQSLPGNFGQWIIRQKLTSIAYFTDISHAFVNDPPLALTSSLGAFDVLQAEQKAFNETLNAFDMMLMEAGIDDKTADELDATRTKIENVLMTIDVLLTKSPKVLQEF